MKLSGDFAKLRQLRQRLGSVATPETKTALARVVGEAARTQLARGFRQSVDPYGAAWAGLKHRKGKPLLDSGRLRSSYTYTATSDGVRIGTNVVHAKFHQYGTDGRKTAGGRFQAVNARGRFRSHAKASKLKRGSVSVRRLNYAAGSGKIPARMMLPVKSRGLGTWKKPLHEAVQRFVARKLRGK